MMPESPDTVIVICSYPLRCYVVQLPATYGSVLLAASSDKVANENGWKGTPEKSANLENDSTHVSLRECSIALVPSMHTNRAIAV